MLPAGDPAHTFSIPLSVIEFDKVPMPNNIRPKREEVKQPKPLPVLPTDDEDNPHAEPRSLMPARPSSLIFPLSYIVHETAPASSPAVAFLRLQKRREHHTRCHL